METDRGVWGREFSRTEDGKLLFQADYTDKENLITWLMSFWDRAELLEPEGIRGELRESIERLATRVIQ